MKETQKLVDEIVKKLHPEKVSGKYVIEEAKRYWTKRIKVLSE